MHASRTLLRGERFILPRILILSFAAVLLLACGAEADARQSVSAGAPKPGQWIEALFSPITDQLNLTPSQQARIEAVANAEFARSQPLLRRLSEITAKLDEEQLKETFDEDGVRALAAQAGQALTELTVSKLRMKAKVVALLTPEQRALVEQQLLMRAGRGEVPSLY